jgi:hypothetical protein
LAKSEEGSTPHVAIVSNGCLVDVLVVGNVLIIASIIHQFGMASCVSAANHLGSEIMHERRMLLHTARLSTTPKHVTYALRRSDPAYDRSKTW